MVELVPLTITARLEQGVAMDSRFGVAFDGLLTSLVRAETKTTRNVRNGTDLDGGLHAALLTEVELPLARCDSSPWHWQATTAYPLGPHRHPVPNDPDIHHIRYTHQREIAEQVALALPTHTPVTQGRFKFRRLPVIVYPANYLQFRAIGAQDTIRSLLDSCHTIGAHRTIGEGRVLEWTVEPAQPNDWGLFAHTHLDGSLGRPVPDECCLRFGVYGSPGKAGIRPPYWHPNRQHPLSLPNYPEGDPHAASED